MEEEAIHNRFSILVKPIGPACNLSCSYCFYREKEALFPDNTRLSDWILKEELLEELIRQYLESQNSPAVQFVWQGGEPTLLGIDYFRKIIALQRKYANGRRIENALQTNGILIDDRWSEFLAKNRFLIGVSIDGPDRFHNRYRSDRNGNPSFDKVLKGIDCLKKQDVEFNTLTAVQKDNVRSPLEVYRFLKEIGQGYMQFIPIVERYPDNSDHTDSTLASPHANASARLSDWSVESHQYGKFLCAVFDEWVRRDVGKVFVQLFDETLAAWVGMEPSLCSFRRTCGTAIVIEHNGDCYSCDHYVYPENRIGNIKDTSLVSMTGSHEQNRFGRNKLDNLPHQCRTCEVLFACNGECPKHRFVETDSGEPGLNYLCPGYKLFFTHVAAEMEFMAAELRAQRPPANIMAWIRNRNQADPGKAKKGRNDPCPCGSGRKFKKCCGKDW